MAIGGTAPQGAPQALDSRRGHRNSSSLTIGQCPKNAWTICTCDSTLENLILTRRHHVQPGTAPCHLRVHTDADTNAADVLVEVQISHEVPPRIRVYSKHCTKTLIVLFQIRE